MKNVVAVLAILMIAGTSAASARNHADYQTGTFIGVRDVDDGTFTDTLFGDGTTVAGSIYRNQISIYRIDVADGWWILEAAAEANDVEMRSRGATALHLRPGKANPLDTLKAGEKVLFRVERHRKLNGVETHLYVPRDNKCDKDADFIAWFRRADKAK
jgi:hypothetical protein